MIQWRIYNTIEKTKVAVQLFGDRTRTIDDIRGVYGQGAGIRNQTSQWAQRRRGELTTQVEMRSTDMTGVINIVEDDYQIGDEFVCAPQGTDAEQKEEDKEGK